MDHEIAYRGYVVRTHPSGVFVYFFGELIDMFPGEEEARAAIDLWMYAP